PVAVGHPAEEALPAMEGEVSRERRLVAAVVLRVGAWLDPLGSAEDRRKHVDPVPGGPEDLVVDPGPVRPSALRGMDRGPADPEPKRADPARMHLLELGARDAALSYHPEEGLRDLGRRRRGDAPSYEHRP